MSSEKDKRKWFHTSLSVSACVLTEIYHSCHRCKALPSLAFTMWLYWVRACSEYVFDVVCRVALLQPVPSLTFQTNFSYSSVFLERWRAGECLWGQRGTAAHCRDTVNWISLFRISASESLLEMRIGGFWKMWHFGESHEELSGSYINQKSKEKSKMHFYRAYE